MIQVRRQTEKENNQIATPAAGSNFNWEHELFLDLTQRVRNSVTNEVRAKHGLKHKRLLKAQAGRYTVRGKRTPQCRKQQYPREVATWIQKSPSDGQRGKKRKEMRGANEYGELEPD